ncbi:50S ribosomal protein L33 [Candidatus Blochmanniella vafra str. BVAF]|uniref:Large ribosomal subunit protein bL33 n=1 Tax=Blochmanniella vafra (strain BVAF) TaxID=859654 RepID=E8Q789_BLOVB|nr:50S ribosomal protein L33 [Candidatus Blochmannia vafer]ADV33984.1 50S ribosomal protein L33 [Candidatus Blochmannia vafer str. BVAF]
MAKEIREIIYLFSSSKNGHFYSTTKNKRSNIEKIRLKKYDPIIRKHVIYVERSKNKK